MLKQKGVLATSGTYKYSHMRTSWLQERLVLTQEGVVATSGTYKHSHKDTLATKEMGTDIGRNAGYRRGRYRHRWECWLQ